MIISDIIKNIEEIAPLKYAASWDKSGMQVACQRDRAKVMAVCLDPLPENIAKAIKMGAEFLLSHHPLALKPELPATRDAYYQALRLLFINDLPLYAAHTSLDVNLSGPSGWLGRELGLRNARPLEKIDASDPGFICGFGEVGDLPEPMPMRSLISRIIELCHCGAARECGPENEAMIARMAYCGGSGASFIDLAQAAGAALYATGDIKYHEALGSPITLLDIGHHSLEEEMMRRFALLLQEMMPELKVVFIPSESPFRIISGQEVMK